MWVWLTFMVLLNVQISLLSIINLFINSYLVDLEILYLLDMTHTLKL